MLRTIVGLAAIAFVLVALVGVVLSPAAWPVLFGALLFAGGCLFERRYHDHFEGVTPGPGFRPTDERFIDPETGRPTVVWADPVSGERRYVYEDDRPPRRP